MRILYAFAYTVFIYLTKPGGYQVNQLKTREQVIDELDRKGISVAAWSREHGLNASTVAAVLKGNRKARIGKSHKAAVLLGIKKGEASG